MEILPAADRHVEQLAVLFDAYRVFYRQPSDLPGAEAFLKKRIANRDSAIFVAIAEDGELAGFTQLYPLFSSIHLRKLWLLNDLFVIPACRKKGIAKQLIEQAKTLARQTHAAGLILETEKSNAIGNNLYPTAGFTLNTHHNYYFWDNPG